MWSETPGKLWKVGETAEGGARENPAFPPFFRLAVASIRRCCTCVPGVFDQMRQHHLRGVALLPALVGPLAGLELALDVDRAALAQVALGDVRQVLVEDHHAVPLGPLARVARLAVLPALRGGDPQVDDLLVALAVAHLGVPPEIAHQDHLVHAAGHRLPTSSSRGLACPRLSFTPMGEGATGARDEGTSL